MKLIPLTKGKFAQVDDEDYDYLMQWKWHVWHNKKKTIFYAKRAFQIKGKKFDVFMHRLLLNTPKGMDTDHKDRDGLNNTRNNLRISSRSQNNINTESRKNTSSKYKGVYWLKKDKRWRVVIGFNNEQIYIGRFKNETEAGEAYLKKAKELYGEFSR